MSTSHMWNVRCAPSCWIQVVSIKNAQNSTCAPNTLHIAVQHKQTKTSLLHGPNTNAHPTWRIELISVFPLSPFSSSSQFRGVMRWGDLSPQRADQRCFEPSEKSVPDFRGKKTPKTLRTQYLMVNSILCKLHGKVILYSHSEPFQFHFFTIFLYLLYGKQG